MTRAYRTGTTTAIARTTATTTVATRAPTRGSSIVVPIFAG
jgi:hypothetical protein